MQYSELLKVDKIHLKFTEEAIREMARIAYLENENNENLGARRLHNVMEMLLEEVSFEADGKEDKEIIVDKEFVQKNLDKALKIMNLKKYIL
jgi:ATP-dependent HslUV protease ATP-binding subunit HslU